MLIELHYAGICHSDIHTVRGEWGPQTYPLTVGHEMVGIVAEIGPQVTRHQVGDRVGVGTMVNSCRECVYCRNGQEQYCANGNIQTYASVDRWHHHAGRLLHPRCGHRGLRPQDPRRHPIRDRGPLLCAGITTYSPLRHWAAGPGKAVAVVGLGGLGHLGVKFAHALGADVTVLSQTLAKQHGLRLGADHYFATSDPETFTKLANRFDLIVNTVSAKIDLDAYLSLLKVDGTLVNVGAPAEPLSLTVGNLVGKRRSFAGSATGGLPQTQEMLNFCAEHHLTADVEIIPADQINRAYERVLASDVRYRFVIDIATLS